MRALALLPFCFVLLLASCATASKAAPPSYAGTWEVMVKSTPLGDVAGQLVLTGPDDDLSGKFMANGATYPLKRATKTAEGISVTFFFPDQGIDVDMTLAGTAASNSLVGSTLGDYMTTAKRSGGQ